MSPSATGPLSTYPGLNTPSPIPVSPSPAPTQPNPWWNPAGLPIWANTLIFAMILILLVGGAGYIVTRNKPVNLQ